MTTKELATVKTREVQTAGSGLLCRSIDVWLAHERLANEASENTVNTYRRSLTVFCSWLADNGIHLGDVVPVDVQDFKGFLSEKYSSQTVNLRLTAVRRFYAWAVTSGRLALNPASEVKGKKRKKSRTHKRDALTGAEVLEVLSSCDTSTLEGLRDRAMLSLFAYCGLRAVEVHRANLGDIRTQDDRLVLEVYGKGSEDEAELAVITMREEPVIRKWLSTRRKLDFAGLESSDPLFVSFSNRSYGGRLSLRAIRHIVTNYFEAAGVVGDRKTTHSLRHSAITNLIKRGASPLVVQRFARHQSFDTTLNYVHAVSRLANPAEDMIDYEANGNH